MRKVMVRARELDERRLNPKLARGSAAVLAGQGQAQHQAGASRLRPIESDPSVVLLGAQAKPKQSEITT